MRERETRWKRTMKEEMGQREQDIECVKVDQYTKKWRVSVLVIRGTLKMRDGGGKHVCLEKRKQRSKP